jgi:hypothetical protein
MELLKKAQKIMIKNGVIKKTMRKKNIIKTEKLIKSLLIIKKKKLNLLMSNRSNKRKRITIKKIKIIIKINQSRSLKKRIKKLNNKFIKSMGKLTKNMRTINQSIKRLNNKIIIMLKKY